MKFIRILIPILIIALLVTTGIVFFDKGTSDYFKGWRSVRTSEKHSVDISVLPFSFFEEEYNGAMVAKGSLHFFSSVSGQSTEFPEELPVFNFIYSPEDSTMYYTVNEDDSLQLKRADFLENTVRLTSISHLHRHKNEFMDPVSLRRGSMTSSQDTVFLESGFSSGSKKFETILSCVPGKEFTTLTMDDFINRSAIELIELQQNEEEKFMKNVMVVKLKAFSDLNKIMNQKPVEIVNYHVESEVNTSADSSNEVVSDRSGMYIADSIEYIAVWE